MKALPHPGERGRASGLTARPEGRTVLMQPFHRRRFPPPAKRGRHRWRRPASVLPLVAGAELGGRLIGEGALAEAGERTSRRLTSSHECGALTPATAGNK